MSTAPKKSKVYRENGPAALDLLEQAVHLLRRNMGALTWYYLGSVPFILAFLFFWAEMSRSAFAQQNLAESSLLVTGAYLWMKIWHAIFTRQMHSVVLHGTFEPVKLSEAGRIAIAQITLQPTALFMLPLALVIALPFGWVSAFYQTLSVLGKSENGRIRSVTSMTWRQTVLWPRQNHVLLAVFSAFSFVVFLNWASVAFMLPALAKMLLGFESVFTRSGTAMLNSTFFMVMLCLTFLTVDPIRKCAYVLRVFYATSLLTGEDIKAELRSVVAAQASRSPGTGDTPILQVVSNGHTGGRPAVFPSVVLGALLACTSNTTAEPSSLTPAEAKPAAAAKNASLDMKPRYSVDPAELDTAIGQVIKQPQFAWRLPREKVEETEKGVVGRFLDRVTAKLEDWTKSFLRWLDKWLNRLFRPRDGLGAPGVGWISYLEVIVYALAGIIVIGVALLVIRMLKSKSKRHEVISQPLPEVPDINDENVRADQLPEDEWMRLGRELLERGELRLAMRAFYLASLAQLADRGLINIARFKSNLDYYRELNRRAHAIPGLVQVFAANLGIFERVWYGQHAVDLPQVKEFAASIPQMRGAQAA